MQHNKSKIITNFQFTAFSFPAFLRLNFHFQSIILNWNLQYFSSHGRIVFYWCLKHFNSHFNYISQHYWCQCYECFPIHLQECEKKIKEQGYNLHINNTLLNIISITRLTSRLKSLINIIKLNTSLNYVENYFYKSYPPVNVVLWLNLKKKLWKWKKTVTELLQVF